MTTLQPPGTQGDWGPDVLESYSDLLLKLYRAGRTAPPDAFRAQAFALLENFIAFDAAYWGLAAVDTGVEDYIGAQVLDVYNYKMPPKTYERYIRNRADDSFVAAASKNPGVTIATSFCDWYPESYWPYVDKLGFHQYMITIVKHPPTGLETGINLMRADAGRPFSETDRRMKQALMPHLIEAFARSQIEPWLRNTLPVPQFPSAAIVDESGALRHAADGFAAMLQTEWPDWRGPALPEPLRTLMTTSKTGHYVGAKIAASFHRQEHMALVQLRPARLADHLSERQLSVARHTAEGLSHKEIGQLTGLRPTTVRNYLSNVYRKLGVSNKLQLADRLREVE